MEVELGKYKHYKGGYYEVIGVARHSESLEEMVMYKNEKNEFWVRPKKIFLESAIVEGQQVPRFKYLSK